MVVYDITNRESFNNINTWIDDCKSQSPKTVFFVLVGNKIDLENEREVTYEEAEKYSKDYDFFDFYETSARTGINTQKVFIKAAITLYEDHLKYKDKENIIESQRTSKEQSHKLTKKSNRKQKQKSGCC